LSSNFGLEGTGVDVLGGGGAICGVASVFFSAFFSTGVLGEAGDDAHLDDNSDVPLALGFGVLGEGDAGVRCDVAGVFFSALGLDLDWRSQRIL
jgi:hypothetical protein